MTTTLRLASLALLSATLFTACKKQEVTYYETPKEQPEVQAPFLQQQQQSGQTPPPAAPMPAAPTPQMDMSAQTLPQSALSSADLPSWSLPANWIEGRAVQMRRASFTVRGAESIDISVNSFPGDVGGLAANINRWRTQIGLAPLPPADAEALATPINASHPSAVFIALPGPTQTTYAAIFMHEGTSWFFKLTGPTALAADQEAPFRQWAQSVSF